MGRSYSFKTSVNFTHTLTHKYIVYLKMRQKISELNSTDCNIL